jgi:GTP-binding protein
VHGLARASNTPGRTRELNVFDADGRLRMVDMPGYGYAKAARKDSRGWQRLMRDYLRGRPGLVRAFVLIDARHGALAADREMFRLLDEAAVTYQLVLTKCDKVNAAELAAAVDALSELAKTRAAAFPAVHATSSVTGQGIAELRAEIAGLL